MTCEICGGVGWFTPHVRYGDPGFGRPQNCPNPNCAAGREQNRRSVEVLLGGTRLPGLFRSCTFTTFEALMKKQKDVSGKRLGYRAALAIARSDPLALAMRPVVAGAQMSWDDTWSDDTRPGLALYGPVGTGKTGLLASITNHLTATARYPLYTTAWDMLESIRRRIGAEEAPRTEDMVRLYQQTPILMIDELKLTNPTDFRSETMEAIIDYREKWALPLLVSTNLSPHELSGVWGVRTADRLLAMMHWVRVGGHHLRSESVGFAEAEES